MNDIYNQILIANWKMYLPFNQATSWIEKNNVALNELATKTRTQIIICPSTEAISTIQQKIRGTDLKLGAQNCSAYSSGAYTGQVAALSLRELGCSFVLIGHSEVRKELPLMPEVFSAQLKQVLEQSMTPVFCIGENAEEYAQKRTFEYLAEQLKPLIQIATEKRPLNEILVAYEPVWSIGTGLIAEASYLNEVVGWIKNQLHFPVKILYGGSVDANTAARLCKIKGISGLLVGKASTDFQLLKKIVLSTI